MSRVEKFKLKRSLRQKYASAVLLFFFILTAGIMSVDLSTNFLLSGRKGIAIISFNSKPTSLEITFMNQKIYVNTLYINRDLNKLKNDLQKLFQI